MGLVYQTTGRVKGTVRGQSNDDSRPCRATTQYEAPSNGLSLSLSRIGAAIRDICVFSSAEVV